MNTRSSGGSTKRKPRTRAKIAPILVTGGTGTLGHRVVARLREARRPVRVLSRTQHPSEPGLEYVVGDLVTNRGIEAAVAGVTAIVHCATTEKHDAIATKHLVSAATALPTPPHIVFISIVGADRIPSSFMTTKLQAETILRESGLPWTILRATQFYDVVLTGARRSARWPVIPAMSGFLVQPIDADEVAARLVGLALGEPAGRVPDIGGPEVMSVASLIRVYLRTTRRRRLVVPVWFPGISKIRAGGLLVRKRKTADAATDDVTGAEPPRQRTWEEFLQDTA